MRIAKAAFISFIDRLRFTLFALKAFESGDYFKIWLLLGRTLDPRVLRGIRYVHHILLDPFENDGLFR